MTQEALKMALEALTYIYTETTADEDELIDQAITAIEEALAQPEQEPMAWMDEEINCAYTSEELDGGTAEGLIPLYTTPPKCKPLLDEFGYWWFEYGSGLYPLEREDQEEHAYRVANAAWKAAHGIKGD